MFLLPSKLAPLVNLIIRALTLLGKFVLLFYIAKFLSINEVGVYGLIVVVVSYALYAVGFDFYTYSTRELIRQPRSDWSGYLKKQLQLILITYIILLPLISVGISSIIDYHWLIYLCILIVLEHLNQEMMRLLIIDNKSVLASNLMFIRGGLWCYVSIALMYFHLIPQNLNSVLLAWISFDLISLSIGIYSIRKYLNFYNSAPVSLTWITNGLKICIPLLFSTLVVRAITTLDRIWLENLEGIEVVAAYALFVGLTNSMISFLDTGVFSFIYPKMISSSQHREEFFKHVRKMIFQSTLLISLISIVLVSVLPYLLDWIGKETYQQYRYVFYIILLANIFYCFSMIPHYILYACNRDKLIIFSHILGLLVFILSSLLFIYNHVPIAIAYGVCCAFFAIFIAKIFFSHKVMTGSV